MTAATLNRDARAVAFHGCSECSDAAKTAGRIRAGRKVFKMSRTVGQTAEQRIAMGNTLIAGQAQAAEQVAGGRDHAGRCGLRQARAPIEGLVSGYNVGVSWQGWRARHP